MPRAAKPRPGVIYMRLDDAVLARLDAAIARDAARDGQRVSRPEYVRRVVIQHLLPREAEVTAPPTST